MSDTAETTAPEPPKSAAEQIGDEWTANESAMAEGWLDDAPEPSDEPEPPVEEAAPASELLPDEEVVRSVGADPDELLALAEDPQVKEELKKHPHWVTTDGERELTDAELRSNAAILNGLVNDAYESRNAKQDLLGEAIQKFEEAEDPAAIANALQQLDPDVAKQFADYWRDAEADPPTALEWLSSQNQLKGILDLAAEAQAEEEATKKVQEQAKNAFDQGVAAFEKGFTESQRAPLGDAMAALRTLLEHGIDIPTESPEAVERALRVTLTLAKEWDAAQRAAKTSVEWEKDNLDYIGGYMGQEEKRRTYDEHLKAEIEKNDADNPEADKYPLLKAFRAGTLSELDFQLPVTTAEDHAQMLADTFDAPDPRAAGWNVGPKIEPKKGKVSPILDDPLFDDPDQRAREEGWNIA
jgi:hypothetical protein